jgi:adenylate kinase
MQSQPQTYIFFGKSGSGKGTQAELLKKYLEEKDSRKVLYVETGARFREFMDKGSYSSKLTKEVMKTGGLLPVFMPVWIWTDFLVNNLTGEEHMILDGLCRRPAEAPVLDSAMKFYKREKPVIVYINTSNDWAMARLKGRGRADDGDDYIKSRLDWFEWNVLPALSFFHSNGDYTFLEINGERTVEEVHEDILTKISSIQG